MRIETLPRERWLGGIGAGGLIAALVCAVVWPRAALTGWLGAAVLLQALPVGALTLLAMMQLIRGEWEAELRPVCEAAALLLPLAALAFVPVLLGMTVLYDWDTQPALSDFQAAWLSPMPFALRTVLWFAALAAIGWSLLRRRAGEGASALALIVIALGASLVAVDWLMSLDPHFHSSAFGLQLLTLEIGAAYMVLLLFRLALVPPPARPGVLGGLLLVMLLLWFYFQFLSYLVVWSGNLPDGAAWYLDRSHGIWGGAVWAIALLGIAPLLALFFAPVRQNPGGLRLCAATALAGKAIEFGWFSLPGKGWPAALAFSLALLGFGCLTVAGLAMALRWREAAA